MAKPKRKVGRKPKTVQDVEQELLLATHRPGEAMRAAINSMGDEREIPEGSRLTAAEIAWNRLVLIARGENDSLAMDASKFIIERTFGKAAPKLPTSGEHSLTIVIT